MNGDDLKIDLETNEHGGRYVLRIADGPEATMRYRTLDAATIAIDSTFVPPEYRGRGIAQALVERGIADARANNVKIKPVCSYVAAQFRRHPAWSDLLAT